MKMICSMDIAMILSTCLFYEHSTNMGGVGGRGGNDVCCLFVGSDILKIKTMYCLILIFSLQTHLNLKENT